MSMFSLAMLATLFLLVHVEHEITVSVWQLSKRLPQSEVSSPIMKIMLPPLKPPM
ncbi:MAG TPA: hypothetical protein VGM65_15400 [Candidatus Udaeobacter sp.]